MDVARAGHRTERTDVLFMYMYVCLEKLWALFNPLFYLLLERER